MSNWTQGDVDAIKAKQQKLKLPAKPSKYRNVKVEINGEKFDSKREANYWVGLKMREKAGEISTLARQVSYDLECPTHNPDECVVVAHYIADFRYYEIATKTVHVVDAKGKRTAMYALKKKWLELQDGIVIEEV
jgi:hypothetical protein